MTGLTELASHLSNHKDTVLSNELHLFNDYLLITSNEKKCVFS